MDNLFNFNAFGEARVKSTSAILTATAVKSLDETVYNEVEIIEFTQELEIDDNDQVRILFAANMVAEGKHKIIKRQVSGATLDLENQAEIDKAVIAILNVLYVRLNI